jgi:hypothetical protein
MREYRVFCAGVGLYRWGYVWVCIWWAGGLAAGWENESNFEIDKRCEQQTMERAGETKKWSGYVCAAERKQVVESAFCSIIQTYQTKRASKLQLVTLTSSRHAKNSHWLCRVYVGDAAVGQRLKRKEYVSRSVEGC